MGTPSGSTVTAIQVLSYQVLGLLFVLSFTKGHAILQFLRTSSFRAAMAKTSK